MIASVLERDASSCALSEAASLRLLPTIRHTDSHMIRTSAMIAVVALATIAINDNASAVASEAPLRMSIRRNLPFLDICPSGA